jgi:hypothetical protein
MSHVAFAFVLALALAFFSYNAQRLVRYLRIGNGDFRLNDIPRRVWNLFMIGIAQTKILRDPSAGPVHALVFWGFLVLQVGALEIILHGLIPGFSYASILPAPLHWSSVSQELTAGAVLAAVASGSVAASSKPSDRRATACTRAMRSSWGDRRLMVTLSSRRR